MAGSRLVGGQRYSLCRGELHVLLKPWLAADWNAAWQENGWANKLQEIRPSCVGPHNNGGNVIYENHNYHCKGQAMLGKIKLAMHMRTAEVSLFAHNIIHTAQAATSLEQTLTHTTPEMG